MTGSTKIRTPAPSENYSWEPTKLSEICGLPPPRLYGLICGRTKGHEGSHVAILVWETKSPSDS